MLVEYYATSKDMKRMPTPRRLLDMGMWIEYNPNIGLYRVNGDNGVSLELAGYSPHKTALMSRAIKYAIKN